MFCYEYKISDKITITGDPQQAIFSKADNFSFME